MTRRSKIPVKKEEEDLILTKVQPFYPRDRHVRDELRQTKIQPSHPRDSMAGTSKIPIKKELDTESLTQTPYVNVDLILDSTEKRQRENTIMDRLLQN